jgi:hypothetical protein
MMIYIYSITCVLSMKNLLQFIFIFMSSRILYKLKNLISVLHKDSLLAVYKNSIVNLLLQKVYSLTLKSNTIPLSDHRLCSSLSLSLLCS